MVPSHGVAHENGQSKLKKTCHLLKKIFKNLHKLSKKVCHGVER